MTSQYGAYRLRAGLGRLYIFMRMHTPTRPGTHMHARASIHTQTLYVVLIAFPLQQWFRKRASVLRYTMYIGCIVGLIMANNKLNRSLCVLFIV
jgi:hypothetical protein